MHEKKNKYNNNNKSFYFVKTMIENLTECSISTKPGLTTHAQKYIVSAIANRQKNAKAEKMPPPLKSKTFRFNSKTNEIIINSLYYKKLNKQR